MWILRATTDCLHGTMTLDQQEHLAVFSHSEKRDNMWSKETHSLDTPIRISQDNTLHWIKKASNHETRSFSLHYLEMQSVMWHALTNQIIFHIRRSNLSHFWSTKRAAHALRIWTRNDALISNLDTLLSCAHRAHHPKLKIELKDPLEVYFFTETRFHCTQISFSSLPPLFYMFRLWWFSDSVHPVNTAWPQFQNAQFVRRQQRHYDMGFLQSMIEIWTQ